MKTKIVGTENSRVSGQGFELAFRMTASQIDDHNHAVQQGEAPPVSAEVTAVTTSVDAVPYATWGSGPVIVPLTSWGDAHQQQRFNGIRYHRLSGSKIIQMTPWAQSSRQNGRARLRLPMTGFTSQDGTEPVSSAETQPAVSLALNDQAMKLGCTASGRYVHRVDREVSFAWRSPGAELSTEDPLLELTRTEQTVQQRTGNKLFGRWREQAVFAGSLTVTDYNPLLAIMWFSVRPAYDTVHSGDLVISNSDLYRPARYEA